jgi:hypothetical protein
VRGKHRTNPRGTHAHTHTLMQDTFLMFDNTLSAVPMLLAV